MKKPQSRQLRWQQKRMRVGLCQQCGKKRNLGKSWCDKCLSKSRKRQQCYKGFKPWQPGGCGRPPLEHKERYLKLKLSKLMEKVTAVKTELAAVKGKR